MPNSVDAAIGARVRARRVAMNISQGDLGRRVGVSSQQIQRYEIGVNTISASKLHRISEVLRLPAGYFFEDLTLQPDAPPARVASHRMALLIDCLEPKRRAAVSQFVRALAKEEGVDIAEILCPVDAA